MNIPDIPYVPFSIFPRDINTQQYVCPKVIHFLDIHQDTGGKDFHSLWSEIIQYCL